VGSIPVRVQARARSDAIVGLRSGALLVRVAAPPVEGKANDALTKLLARRLGVSPSRVSVVRGASYKDKLIAVDGTESQALRRELGLPG
jgi:uncharacterized protein